MPGPGSSPAWSHDPGPGPADGRPEPGPSPRASPVLALRGAGRSYGGFEALRPLDLEIARGERVAVVGPSGAGKSTLLSLLATALAPSAGEVVVLGERPAGLSPRALRRLRARIGTIYQQLLLVPQASVMQNVVAGQLGRTSLLRSLLALVSGREAERIRALLDQVGIADKIFERVDRLSGGEQQRVAIARTLHQDPEIVVADEPLASVDPARSAGIVALFARAFAGRTLVVSTHRIEPLLAHVDRVIGLRRGAIVFDRPAAAVTLDDLAHLYESRRGAAVSPPPPGPGPAPGPATAGEPPTLAVGASSTPAQLLLPRIVRAFVRGHPGVRVSLTVKDSAEVAGEVLAGRVELGLVGARSPRPELAYENVVEDEIVLVAAPSLGLGPRPIAAEQLASLRRIDREPGSGTRAVVEEHLGNMGVSLDPAAAALEVDTLVGVKAAAMSGMGVAFVSRLAVRDEIEAGLLRVVAVEGLRIPRNVFAVYRRDRGLSPSARAFLALARAPEVIR
ncbi:MAG TPA: LysR substrate-binding domain-containing protein [Anaeromyxobacteraceae bacterium]|nr:LysR substrate-binding domain-containing protein [Anaeromyxobacteraceae bacterium]